MTRLYVDGAEFKDATLAGMSLSGAVTHETTTIHPGGGKVSYKCVGATAGTSAAYHNFTYTVGRHYYFRCWFFLPAGQPSDAHFDLMQVGGISVTVDNTQNFGLFISATSTTHAGLGTVTTGAWHLVECHTMVPASGNGALALKVDGVSLYSNLAEPMGTTTPSTAGFGCGFNASNTATVTVYIDDIAINDDQGTVNNTFPGDGRVILLLPASDSSRGSWTTGAGGTTSLFAAVDNTPPLGVAQASATATSQIKDIATTNPDNYVANLSTYAAAGVGASDTINSVQGFAAIASQTTTSISHGLAATNPTLTKVTAAQAVAAAAYPTGWAILKTALVEQPTVTVGTAPTVTLSKNTANASGANFAFGGLLVDYTPVPIISSGVVNMGGTGDLDRGYQLGNLQSDGLAQVIANAIINATSLGNLGGGLSRGYVMGGAAGLSRGYEMGGAGGLDRGYRFGGSGGLSRGYEVGGGAGGLFPIVVDVLEMGVVGSRGGGLSRGYEVGGSGGLLATALVLTATTFGGSGGLVATGTTIIQQTTVHFGNTDSDGLLVPLAFTGDPNGHWAEIAPEIWRETFPGSGIGQWNNVPVLVWRETFPGSHIGHWVLLSEPRP